MATFQHKTLQLVTPDFDSNLMDALMELNHLRRLRLYGSTAPWLFFQLKDIFHLFESVGSARIEGNRTTVSEYIEQKLDKQERASEQFSEIANVEAAMEYVDENIDVGSNISHHFIRELHQICVKDLIKEGDRTPGSYRSWPVEISSSNHLPPEAHSVQGYMDELLSFINNNDAEKYDLIKVAIAHHRFTWIHPFGNGNGRVVRLLTYALLIKFGFRVKDGQLINPTAVFCNDRDKYYDLLSIADQGDHQSLLQWCEYVLTGICAEISKINHLLDHQYLAQKILIPAVSKAKARRLINEDEERILKMGVMQQSFKASDINKIFTKLSARQITHMIQKLKASKMILPTKPNGREYFVVFNNSYLLRSLMKTLQEEGFIPSIDS